MKLTPETLPEWAHDQVERLAAQVEGQVVLVVWPDDSERSPYVAANANTAGTASMAKAICEVATREPRPDACPVCMDAWDALQQAAVVLAPVRGSC